MLVFQKIWCAFFSSYLRFKIRPFALWLTIMETITRSVYYRLIIYYFPYELELWCTFSNYMESVMFLVALNILLLHSVKYVVTFGRVLPLGTGWQCRIKNSLKMFFLVSTRLLRTSCNSCQPVCGFPIHVPSLQISFFLLNMSNFHVDLHACK